MKKLPVLILLVATSLLAACSAVQSVLPSVAGAQAQVRVPTGMDPSSLDDETRLLIGTLKLEGTDLAVSVDQAKQLLPLWKAVKSLGSSESAAEGEIQALYAQIKETMTAEQVKSIETLDIAQEDMTGLMSSLGIDMSAPGDTPEVSEDQQATMQTLRQSGNRSGGGGPGGGGPVIAFEARPGGGGMIPPGGMPGQEDGTPVTPGAGSRRSMGMSRVFLDPLIKLLEERAAG